jgi:hypothetical protein
VVVWYGQVAETATQPLPARLKGGLAPRILGLVLLLSVWALGSAQTSSTPTFQGRGVVTEASVPLVMRVPGAESGVGMVPSTGMGGVSWAWVGLSSRLSPPRYLTILNLIPAAQGACLAPSSPHLSPEIARILSTELGFRQIGVTLGSLGQAVASTIASAPSSRWAHAPEVGSGAGVNTTGVGLGGSTQLSVRLLEAAEAVEAAGAFGPMGSIGAVVSCGPGRGLDQGADQVLDRALDFSPVSGGYSFPSWEEYCLI